MNRRPACRPGLWGLALVLGLCLAPGSRAAGEEAGLVVHEWGTFTNLADDEGKQRTWSPLELTDDLPDFVHTDNGKPNPCTVRMETPVMFFYSPKPIRDVSVDVQFPKGHLTEWYPTAIHDPQELSWSVVELGKAADAAAFNLPKVAPGNRYAQARSVIDAADLMTRTPDEHFKTGLIEQEKFLFYRGIGTFDLPLQAWYDNGKIAMRAGPHAGLGNALVIDTRGGSVEMQFEPIADGPSRVEIPSDDGDEKRLSPSHRISAWLGKAGLTSQEAAAMVATWKDYWLEDKGLRVLYILPRKQVDEILPLTIKPEPDKLVRVMVCRIEIFTPSMYDELLAGVRKVDVDSQPARKELLGKWRYSRVMLEAILRHPPDAETAEKIKKLDPGAAAAVEIQKLQTSQPASMSPAGATSSGNP